MAVHRPSESLVGGERDEPRPGPGGRPLLQFDRGVCTALLCARLGQFDWLVLVLGGGLEISLMLVLRTREYTVPPLNRLLLHR